MQKTNLSVREIFQKLVHLRDHEASGACPAPEIQPMGEEPETGMAFNSARSQ